MVLYLVYGTFDSILYTHPPTYLPTYPMVSSSLPTYTPNGILIIYLLTYPMVSSSYIVPTYLPTQWYPHHHRLVKSNQAKVSSPDVHLPLGTMPCVE